MAVAKVREKYGDTDPFVTLPKLPKSLLDKKLREYFEDVGLVYDPLSLPGTSSSSQTEIPSQSSPSVREVREKPKHGESSKKNRSLPSPTTSSNVCKVSQAIQADQPQPSPDSTSVDQIDYKSQFNLKEFHIPCDPLTQDLYDLATSGQLNWKTFFKTGQTEVKVINRKSTSSKTSNKVQSSKEREYLEDDISEVESTSHGESLDSDFSDNEGSRKKKNKKSKKDKKKKRKSSGGTVEKEQQPEFKCSVCAIKFRTIKSLDKHFNSAHKPVGDPIQCPLCDIISPNPKDHEIHSYEVHEGPKILDWSHKITCKSCPGQVFPGYTEFYNHVINHVEAKEIGYGCTICGWASDKYNNVQMHSKTHIQFKCTFCEKMYNKLKLVENHCCIYHKAFGRPFSCSLCDFRSSVYGLLEEHRESSHAIKIKIDGVDGKQKDMCLLCGDSNFIFTTREITLDHLSQHAKIHLYKCIECDFTGESQQVFDDHFIETHISLMIDTDTYFEETNVDRIMDKIATLVKKKVSNERSRNRPNVFETQSAVAAILDDSANENSSYGDPSDRYFDFVALEEEKEDQKRKQKKGKKKNCEVSMEIDETEVNLSGRPKRKSFMDAQVKLSASKSAQIKEEDERSDVDEEEKVLKDKSFELDASTSKKMRREVNLKHGIPMTETNYALDALNTSFDGTVVSYIPEELTSPSQNQQFNTQLTQQYQTISKSTASRDEVDGGQDEDDDDDDFDPDTQYSFHGKSAVHMQPRESSRIVPSGCSDSQGASATSWNSYNQIPDPTSLTPFGPTGTCDEGQTYYEPGSKTLVINGVPVYDAQGNVAQVEPHEIEQVFALYNSQAPVVEDPEQQYAGC